jgi:hypothetical protein
MIISKVSQILTLLSLVAWSVSGQPNPNPQPSNPAPADPSAVVSQNASASQAPATTTTTTVAPPPTPECNPYLRQCENADCADADSYGQVLIWSPNKNAYNYIGMPLLVNWTYTPNSDPNFPVNNVYLYYKNAKEKTWTQCGIADRRNKTYLWDVPALIPGSYEVYKSLMIFLPMASMVLTF